MRDIKFRVWDKNRQKFVCCYQSELNFTLDTGQVYNNGFNCTNNLILCQFTGLTDKNGVDIYEGDILSPEAYLNTKFGTVVVEFKDGMFCFAINKPFIASTNPLIKSLRNANKSNNKFVVIGNIHQNKDLLGG